MSVTIKAIQALSVAETALNKIASWPEGKVVNPSFDEPGSAQIARDALVQIEKIAMEFRDEADLESTE